MTMPALEPAAVLVVDDDQPLHGVYSRMVELAGGEAFLAANGEEAQSLLAEREFAVALLDKNLPDTNGIALLTEIKQRHPRTEVLIVTGYANMQSVVQALRLGAFDYVEKPFDVNVLAERVRAAIAKRRRLAADVAQLVEGPLGRLAGELEVVAEVMRTAVARLREADHIADTITPLKDMDQACDSLRDAAESARQIAQALSKVDTR